jgi:hypothetical protein
MRRSHLAVGVGLASLAVASVAARPAAVDRPPSALIAGMPHVRQKPDFCGEACVAMALRKLGVPADQDDVFDAAGVDPLLARGAFTRELADAVERLGFRPSPVWYTVAPGRAERELGALLDGMVADLARGVPSIVCTRFDESPRATEHFRLVLGYDRDRDEIVFHDPALADGAYRRMPRARFLGLWPLKYKRDAWTVIRIPLEPVSGMALAARASGVTPAAHAQHLMKVRPAIPDGWATRIVGPFLVIADPGDTEIGHHADVIDWVVTRLQHDFGMVAPPDVIDVWLLSTDEGYVAQSERLFNERPSTPYGFFVPARRTMLMNIGTGGGTLVHELVHPFLRASFPRAPAWFDEGLASLYERVVDRDGHLWGLPNWRLAGLQRAVRTGQLPTLARMTAESNQAFYDSPTGYAEARALCLYLQEKGLLGRFYAAYRDGYDADPTGFRTLAHVLGERDMVRFQLTFEAWALKLREPP